LTQGPSVGHLPRLRSKALSVRRFAFSCLRTVPLCLYPPVLRDMPQAPQKWFKYYWSCLEHLGVEVYRAGRTEVFSSLGITCLTFVIAWKIGDHNAKLSFQIAVFATLTWLGLFALFHAFRTPWLIHRAPLTSHHWGWGILGITVVTLLFTGAIFLGLWIYPKPPIIKLQGPTIQVVETQIKKTGQSLRQRTFLLANELDGIC
jgi:hypothetical protein